MTELRDKAFEEASRLPEINQNALVKWILDELKNLPQRGRLWINPWKGIKMLCPIDTFGGTITNKGTWSP